MIPFDTKNYRARREFFNSPEWAVIGIGILLTVLGWMGERDYQAKVEQIKLASAGQCTD